MAIKKNDTVLVTTGKDKGKKGKVLRVLSAENRVVVEGVNLRKKKRRARKAGEKGQTIQITMPIDLSNVMLLCPQCAVATRRASSVSGDQKKSRLCKKCGATFI